MSNSLDQDQARQNVGPDLCSKGYQQTTPVGKELAIDCLLETCNSYFELKILIFYEYLMKVIVTDAFCVQTMFNWF